MINSIQWPGRVIWLTHHPFKVKITGSIPVRATKSSSSDPAGDAWLGDDGAEFEAPFRFRADSPPHSLETSQTKASAKSNQPTASITNATAGGRITLAGIHHHFLLFALAVGNRERAAIGRNQFHLDFVELAVIGLRRGEGQAVLVAQIGGQVMEDSRNFSVKLRKPGVTTGKLRKGAQLVFSLQ